MLIDTHCHLSGEDYDNLDEIINNMGNNIMIVSGVNDKTNEEVMNLIEKYPNVYGMIGIHPGDIDTITDNTFDKLKLNLKHPKIIGVGEIGLDYHYPNIDKKGQQEVFLKQINIARDYNKPIIIHSRDAYQDTYNILKDNSDLKIVMHCYSYSLESAIQLKQIGCLFGIGGVITFKNSHKLKEVVEYLSLEDMVLETDSPYLTPEPFRGTKNEPKYVEYVAKKISEIKEISLEKVINITTKNAISQFDLETKL